MKYRVHFETVAGATVYVDAQNEDEAVKKACEELPYSMCASCSGWGRSYSMEMGEWDLIEESAEDGIRAVEPVEDE